MVLSVILLFCSSVVVLRVSRVAASTLQVHKLHPDAAMVGELTVNGVEYWKWIDEQTIVIVTAACVSHWNIKTSMLLVLVLSCSFDWKSEDSFAIFQASALEFFLDVGFFFFMLVSSFSSGRSAGESV